MPPPLYYDGTRLPASYANFYIVNGGIIMPSFDCPCGRDSGRQRWAAVPRPRCRGNPSSDLVWGLGAIHCLTQQHPRTSPN